MRKGGKSEGWKVEKLGDVIQLEYGKPLDASKRSEDGKYPVYGANGEIARSNEYYYDKPTMIVGRKGSAGEINLTEKKFWALDVTYFVTFDDKKYDLQFLYYLLSKLELTKLAKGVKPGINRNDVYSIEVAIPPLPEQQRIVSVLDEAFASIAQAKSNAERNLVNARELFQSYSQDVFTKRGAGWKEMSLGDVCEFENGDRGKNYPNRHEYVETGIPWINTGHIQPDGTLSQSEMNYITKQKFESLRSGKIQSGDLVYCLRGATLGKTAIVDPFTEGAVASSLVIIRAGDLLDNHFLYYFLTSPYGQGLIKLYSNGAAQPNLGAQSVAKYTIFLPPLAEQRAIVGRLEALSAETGRLEEIYQQKVESLEELKKSVLGKAFEGNL